MAKSKMQDSGLTRRDFIKASAVSTTLIVAGTHRAHAAGIDKIKGKVVQKGRIKQSVCGGCLRKARMDPEQTASLLTKMGVVGRDLVSRNDWPLLKKHGLVATMVSGAGSIRKGLNNKSMHPKFLDDFKNNHRCGQQHPLKYFFVLNKHLHIHYSLFRDPYAAEGTGEYDD